MLGAKSLRIQKMQIPLVCTKAIAAAALLRILKSNVCCSKQTFLPESAAAPDKKAVGLESQSFKCDATSAPNEADRNAVLLFARSHPDTASCSTLIES
jgi:hypothetical protein